MTADMLKVFGSITAPSVRDDIKHSVYSAVPISDGSEYFVGKDQHGNACFLVLTTHSDETPISPIRLEALEVQFQTHCRIQKPDGSCSLGPMTVLRCVSAEIEVVQYFLLVCDTLVRTVGSRPQSRMISTFVYRLASIFERLRRPGSRLVNGLFGELYVIASSTAPVEVLDCWRIDASARFDFVIGDLRMDVKTSSGRVRAHPFSFDQCNPPSGSTGIVASMFVERVAHGLTLASLIDRIERHLGGSTELAWKLHEVVAETLGASLSAAMGCHFDEQVTRSSLRFYDVSGIPAIRGAVPSGVSNIKFESNLSGSAAIEGTKSSNLYQVLGDLWPLGK